MKFRIIESVTTDSNGVAVDCVYTVQMLTKILWIIPIWNTFVEEAKMGKYYTEVDKQFNSVDAAEEYIKTVICESKLQLTETHDTIVKYINSKDL